MIYKMTSRAQEKENKNNLMGSSIKLSNRHISAAGLVSSALFFSLVWKFDD